MSFCWCGLPLEIAPGHYSDKGLCPKHKGKPKPEQRQRIKKWRGDSKYAQEQGLSLSRWE